MLLVKICYKLLHSPGCFHISVLHTLMVVASTGTKKAINGNKFVGLSKSYTSHPSMSIGIVMEPFFYVLDLIGFQGKL